jgi:hypothetical protein
LHLAFAEFSARCLREHSKRGTRFLHFSGTTLFLACVALLCIPVARARKILVPNCPAASAY